MKLPITLFWLYELPYPNLKYRYWLFAFVVKLILPILGFEHKTVMIVKGKVIDRERL